MFNKIKKSIFLLFILSLFSSYTTNITAKSENIDEMGVNYREYVTFIVENDEFVMKDMIDGKVDLSKYSKDADVLVKFDIDSLQRNLNTAKVLNRESFLSYSISEKEKKVFKLFDNQDGTYSFKNKNKNITLKELSIIENVQIILSDTWDSNNKDYFYGQDLGYVQLFKINVASKYDATATIQYVDKKTNEIVYTENYENELKNWYGESLEIAHNSFVVPDGYVYAGNQEDFTTIHYGYENIINIPVNKLSEKLANLQKLLNKAIDSINSDIMFTIESKNKVKEKIQFAQEILKKDTSTDKEINDAYLQLKDAYENLVEVGNETETPDTSDVTYMSTMIIVLILALGIYGLSVYRRNSI